MRSIRGAATVAAALAVAVVATPQLSTARPSTPSSFTNTVLIATGQVPGLTTSPTASSTGNSEPAIAFGSDGTMAVDGLAWLPYQVNLWKGRFGSTPGYFGAMDTQLSGAGEGRTVLGDFDADTEITSAGTTLLADLDMYMNAQGGGAQLGVSVTRCPAAATGPRACTTAYLDTAGSDRQWLTSAGGTAWIAYHDASNSSIIRVQTSTDDGRTWQKVGSPIGGQGAATGEATYNNVLGPIVADPVTGDLYESYAAGEPQTKATSGNYNNIYVSRSTDGGRHWTVVRVVHADPYTRLNNFWPSLAVDPSTHRVVTAWADTHRVWVSGSSDHGQTWSAPTVVSSVATSVMPWVAARNGKVDVVYYGSSGTSTNDTTAVWNVYDSQLVNGAWAVKRVSATPNHVGVICVEGSRCTGSRELLDLFEVALDPATNRAAIIYTDTTINTWTAEDGVPHRLPEIVLAFER